MTNSPHPDSPSLSRRDKLLQQEVDPCDDPVCCCEPEPRWVRFNEGPDGPPSEWESLDRTPGEEL